MPKTKTDGDRLGVQVRLPVDLMRTVDHFAVDWDLYRAGAMERLLRKGIEAVRAEQEPSS